MVEPLAGKQLGSQHRTPANSKWTVTRGRHKPHQCQAAEIWGTFITLLTPLTKTYLKYWMCCIQDIHCQRPSHPFKSQGASSGFCLIFVKMNQMCHLQCTQAFGKRNEAMGRQNKSHMIGLALVLKPNKNKALLFTYSLLLSFRAKLLRLRLIYSLASWYLVSNTPSALITNSLVLPQWFFSASPQLLTTALSLKVPLLECYDCLLITLLPNLLSAHPLLQLPTSIFPKVMFLSFSSLFSFCFHWFSSLVHFGPLELTFPFWEGNSLFTFISFLHPSPVTISPICAGDSQACPGLFPAVLTSSSGQSASTSNRPNYQTHAPVFPLFSLLLKIAPPPPLIHWIQHCKAIFGSPSSAHI